MGDQWTNESVREFAQGKDPIAAIVDRARDAVFRAAADGWTGPPFDPLQLARLLGLEVVPLDTVTDARIVAGPSGSAIEYNPRRPRGRLRFSIAHEIAHSFFADAASAVRYRTGLGAVPDEDSDDWQLELLCNIAASELLMPNIALPIADIDSEPLDIDVIMQMRAQFDVSTEAILRRVVSGTTHQVACIATSRVSDRADEPSAFRVDYATASRTWSEPVARGEQIDSRSLASCTAVGFTSKSVDDLGERGAFHVQAVGTPAYPGRRYPRVLALVHPLDETRSDSTHLAYVTGNASEPPADGHARLIVHVVNDRARAWGKRGFAGQLSTQYKRVADAFHNWTIASPTNLQLGNAHILSADESVFVASIVAQEGFGASDEARIRYQGLRDGLREVRRAALRLDATVHMPRIGTGQAGGQWELVADVVDEELCRHGVGVTVYTLPRPKPTNSTVREST